MTACRHPSAPAHTPCSSDSLCPHCDLLPPGEPCDALCLSLPGSPAMFSACPVLYIIAVFGYLTFDLCTVTLLCKSGLTTGAQGGFLIVITVELQTLFLDSSHQREESLTRCCLLLKGERAWCLASASDLPGIKFSNNLQHGWDSKTIYCIVKKVYQNGFTCMLL